MPVASGETNTPFEGIIGTTFRDSVPAWDDYRRPGGAAPNIVMIVLDDTGMAQLGCYGGSAQTPAIDSIADDGVRFTNFHATTLCSPSRASLLTGRNHHSVGMGFLSAFDTGFPNTRGCITPKAATVARMLKEEGYATYAVGKWHLTPPQDLSPSGPFDHWPLQKGFDRYYGFMWGEDDQYSPQIWRDNHFTDPPRTRDYHLTDDLVDQAQQMIGAHVSAGQSRPFFLYFAPGAMHAPHQAPQKYIERYRGAFDHGWDVERERVLARQIELGLFPEGTALPPSNPDVSEWSTLSEDEQRLAARMQEVFAGFVEHTDAAVGNLLSFLQTHGLDENTVIVVVSDNGASGEGGSHGSANEYRYFMGVEESLEENLADIDKLGGPENHNHYPSGWAQAGNTPFRFYKTFNYAGGIRVPLIIRSPQASAEAAIRQQFHHIVDIVPTLLDFAGVEPRTAYDGVDQMPIHGRSMRSSIMAADATEPRDTQYFEMFGHRAVWHRGWKAVTNHRQGADYATEVWELYDLRVDPSESQDLARAHPQMLEVLIGKWNEEAHKYGVFPLDDRLHERSRDRGPRGDRDSFYLTPGVRLFNPVSGPNWMNRSWRIRTEARLDSSVDSGVLVAYGRQAAGFAWFLQDGRLVFDYNYVGTHTVIESSPLHLAGVHDLELRMQYRGPQQGTIEALIDEKIVASGDLTLLKGGLGTVSTQVGHSGPSEVSRRFTAPFTFTGHFDALRVELAPLGATEQWASAR